MNKSVKNFSLFSVILFCFMFKAGGAVLASSLSNFAKAQSPYIMQGGSYASYGDMPATVDSIIHMGTPFMTGLRVFCLQDSTTYRAVGGTWIPIRFLTPSDTVSNVLTSYKASLLYATISSMSGKLNISDTTGKWKSASYTPSSSEITAALGYTPVAVNNVYSAGPGIMKAGAEPSASFYIDSVNKVMTVSRATDSISSINDKVNGKVPQSRLINIAGTSFDLSADRTWSPTTTNIPEGTNLYYTSTRFNTAFASKSTSDLSEGTNLYYTPARFNTAFSGKSTTDLAEGTNLYFTNTRSRSSISLTTTGSGAATYNSSTGVLNVPTSGSGTVTSVGLSSTDLAVSGSPVTTAGSITANLSTTGISAGTYRGAVTFDAKGRATAAINPTVNNSVARSLSNTAGSTNRYTISSTQPTFVTYSITMNFTVTALLSSSATVFLEYSVDGGTVWITVSQCTTSFGLGLALTGSNDVSLSGYIPANALVRLRPALTNATASYITGQEVLY